MRTLSIVAEDKVGLLADISYVIGKSKINIESIGVEVIGSKAVISITVKNFDKAREVLDSAGYTVQQLDSIVLKLEDQPGELNKIATMLADADVNIKNMQVISRDGKHTFISLVVDKQKKAEKMLSSFMLAKNE